MQHVLFIAGNVMHTLWFLPLMLIKNDLSLSLYPYSHKFPLITGEFERTVFWVFL